MRCDWCSGGPWEKVSPTGQEQKAVREKVATIPISLSLLFSPTYLTVGRVVGDKGERPLNCMRPEASLVKNSGS